LTIDYNYEYETLHELSEVEWRDINVSGFIKIYLHLTFEDEHKSYGFGTT